MQTRSIIFGVILGMIIVAGPIGALAALDELDGPDTPNVTVERINDTHASVSWTTEEPTYGDLVTYVQPECNSAWIAVDSITDSSFSRMHHVISPIYNLNKTKTKRTFTNHSEGYDGTPAKRFKVSAFVYTNGSGAPKVTNHPKRYDVEYDRVPPKRFDGTVFIHTNGSGASKIVLQRNHSGTC